MESLIQNKCFTDFIEVESSQGRKCFKRFAKKVREYQITRDFYMITGDSVYSKLITKYDSVVRIVEWQRHLT